MSYGTQQRGITLIGFIVVLVIVGFFAFIGMRLVPVYIEYNSVVSTMKSLQSEPALANATPEAIRLRLDRGFNIGYVDSVKPQNIKITRSGNGYNLNIKYEVRKPMAYNIEFVAMFDKTVEISRQGSLD
jgi:Tfp pilus assembly protein FimT